MKLTRRTVLSRASLAAAGAVAAPAILHWPANAAEFAYKYGTALPDGHPMVIRSQGGGGQDQGRERRPARHHASTPTACSARTPR